MALDPKGKLEGTIADGTGTGALGGDYIRLEANDEANVVIDGAGSYTINVERSFADPADSAVWKAVPVDVYGTKDITSDVAFVVEEPEGAWYRINVTVHASGLLYGRISK